MNFSILNELFQKLRKNFACLYKLIESISTIDMLQSFAHIAILYDYTRPEYGDTLAVKNASHPILLKISKESPITNNIYLSKETSFILLTGANMSGKSTYLRQIAMLQIMSQIGSFIPATYASIRLTTQIFTRIGTDDNIEFNSSSFEQEMIEMNYILNNFTDNSLILIDELCRSTSKDEGLAISMAICEHIIKSNAFILFATHLHELTCLDTMYSKVVNYHFLTEIKKNDDQVKLVHKYALKKGVVEIENYGKIFFL
jgi:DNA mismatch repair protein MSH4